MFGEGALGAFSTAYMSFVSSTPHMLSKPIHEYLCLLYRPSAHILFICYRFLPTAHWCHVNNRCAYIFFLSKLFLSGEFCVLDKIKYIYWKKITSSKNKALVLPLFSRVKKPHFLFSSISFSSSTHYNRVFLHLSSVWVPFSIWSISSAVDNGVVPFPLEIPHQAHARAILTVFHWMVDRNPFSFSYT